MNYTYNKHQKIIEKLKEILGTSYSVKEGIEGFEEQELDTLYLFDDGASGGVFKNRYEQLELSIHLFQNIKVPTDVEPYVYCRDKLNELKRVVLSNPTFDGLADGINELQEYVWPLTKERTFKLVISLSIKYKQRLSSLEE